MKFLALTVLALALTSCTSHPNKTPADQNEAPEATVTNSASAQEATPPVVKPEGPTATPAQAAKNCVCVKIWMPVCGTNNKTYGNTCEADCAGVKYKAGACEADSKAKQRKLKTK